MHGFPEPARRGSGCRPSTRLHQGHARPRPRGPRALVLGRASAAVRHLVWTLALTSALVLPVLSVALPRWQLPIVTLTRRRPQRRRPSTTLLEPHRRSAAARLIRPPPPEPALQASVAGAACSSRGSGREAHAAGLVDDGSASQSGRPESSRSSDAWRSGSSRSQWMSRRTVRVVDAPWLPLAVELAAGLGITRRLTFLESARASMPMAAGIFTPSVLMPEDANRWPLERLRIVLLHELAHVKRRDCLTHVIAQLACALHWFNPLAWIAARHIRTERERACDDLVLACGTRGSGLRGGAARDRARHARRPLPGAAGRRDARHGAPLAARGPADRDPRSEGAALRRLAGAGRARGRSGRVCACRRSRRCSRGRSQRSQATAAPASSQISARRRSCRVANLRSGLRPRRRLSHVPCRSPRPQIDTATGAGDRVRRSADAIAQEAAQDAHRRRFRALSRARAGRRPDRRPGGLAGRRRRASSRALFRERSRVLAPSASARRKESARPPIRGWSRR